MMWSNAHYKIISINTIILTFYEWIYKQVVGGWTDNQGQWMNYTIQMEEWIDEQING